MTENNHAYTISIIGTANRDMQPWTRETYERMKSSVKSIIYGGIANYYKEVILCSGGAAWSDFVAVDLFYDIYFESKEAKKETKKEETSIPTIKLLLHLPAEWHSDNQHFINKTTDGYTSNKYHAFFEKQTGIKSLEIMNQVMKHPWCDTFTHSGFQARNKMIAQCCDHLVAISVIAYNEYEKYDTMKKIKMQQQPLTSGTLQTWSLCKHHNQKQHVLVFI
jgi:hypothetical protein